MLWIVMAGRLELSRARTGAIAGLAFCVSGVLFLLIPYDLAASIGSMSFLAAAGLLVADAHLFGGARRAPTPRRPPFVRYVVRPVALALPLAAVALLVPVFPRHLLAAIAIAGGAVILIQDVTVRRAPHRAPHEEGPEPDP